MIHTKEPWMIHTDGVIYCADGFSPTSRKRSAPERLKYKQRIVSAVNGCTGINDPENTVPDMLAVVNLIHSAAKAQTGHGGVAHYSWREALADTQRIIDAVEGKKKGKHEDKLQ